MIEEAGGRAYAFVADVTDAMAVGTTMAEIERTLGPIRLLVNNAARQGPMGPFCETDVGEWWRALAVNLSGPMLCSRAVLPGMISRHEGRIVNIASSPVPIAYFSSYVTSKTALIRFTETVATEVGPYGVRMFAVGPGTVRTAMSEYALNSPEGQKWLPWFRRIFDEGLDVPVERPARLVLELASGRADSLTGRFLSVSDDPDALLRNVKKIEENHLFSLRVRTMDGGGVSSAIASIRAEAERAARYSLTHRTRVRSPARAPISDLDRAGSRQEVGCARSPGALESGSDNRCKTRRTLQLECRERR
jgi:NAD(P)-dependent dehydrogenase (short-subunit alcohol dehydrogenase family)